MNFYTTRRISAYRNLYLVPCYPICLCCDSFSYYCRWVWFDFGWMAFLTPCSSHDFFSCKSISNCAVVFCLFAIVTFLYATLIVLNTNI